MAKKSKKSKKSRSDTGAEVRESARKIWLAGLGALSVAEAEGSKVFKLLIEEGEGFEARSRSRASRLAEGLGELRSRAGRVVDRLGSELDERVSGALGRVGVPTREEFRKLSRKIEQLSESVGRLKVGRRSAPRRKAAAPKGASVPSTARPADG